MAYQHTVDIGNGTRRLLAALAIWGLAVAIAAAAGLYRALPAPLVGPLVVLGIVLPVAVYALSSSFQQYIEAIGLRSLTVIHIWRIAAALLFFWYGAHNLLPGAFVRNAGWGDLFVGLFALALALLPDSRNRYLAFHLIGFADLVVAITTGLMFTLLNDPRMDAIRTLPLALIPLYGVGIAGATHLMAFDLLRRGVGMKPEAKQSAV